MEFHIKINATVENIHHEHQGSPEMPRKRQIEGEKASKKVQKTISIPKTLFQLIDEYATRHGQDFSEATRNLIGHGLVKIAGEDKIVESETDKIQKSISLTQPLVDRATIYASRHGQDFSAAIRNLIEQGLEKIAEEDRLVQEWEVMGDKKKEDEAE